MNIYTYSEEPKEKHFCYDCGKRIQDWRYRKIDIPKFCPSCQKEQPLKEKYYQSDEYKKKLQKFLGKHDL